eukprot:547672_1
MGTSGSTQQTNKASQISNHSSSCMQNPPQLGDMAPSNDCVRKKEIPAEFLNMHASDDQLLNAQDDNEKGRHQDVEQEHETNLSRCCWKL